MSIAVKICGINSAAAADAVARAGADFGGLVFFAKSPRALSIEDGAQLAARLRGRLKLTALVVDADDAVTRIHLYDAETFAPVGELVPVALAACDRGATVVCAGIHMSDIPSFAYELLWEERVLRSVANLTRADGNELLELAPQVPVRTSVTRYPLERANEALADLRAGRFHGAAVLVP